MHSSAPSLQSPAAGIPIRERLLAWKEILETANPPVARPLDTVGKWLVITRAAVFPMTIWSGLIGGLLAVEANRVAGGAPVDWGLFLLAVVGLVLAHAANNMINDYFDTTGGVDTDDYVRALYAPHPILSGWVTKRQLGIAIVIVNAIGAAIMLALAAVRGPLIIVFALAGLFVSVFYVAPPIRLKHHGLGEPGRVPGLGSADDRRHLPRRHRHDPRLGPARVDPVRAARDVGPVREAHRQDRGRHQARRPDAAGDPGRVARADGRAVADDPVLPVDDRRRARRLDRAVGAVGRARPCRD